jgi:Protein of unknown function (DUF2012)
MRGLLLQIAALLIIASQGWASSKAPSTLPIEGVLEIPNGELAVNYQITLNGGEYTTISRHDGSFTFFDVPSGIYTLDVLAIKYAFPQVKIKVNTELTNAPPVAVTSAETSVNGENGPVGAGNDTIPEHKHAQAINVVEYKYPGAMRIPAGKVQIQNLRYLY